MAVFRKYWLDPEPPGERFRGEQPGVRTQAISQPAATTWIWRLHATCARRDPLRVVAAILGLVLCIGVGVRPSFAASAPQSPVTVQSIDNDLAQRLQVSAQDARIPVLIEAVATPPASAGRDGNQRRAQRAADVASRSGGRVGGQIAMLGAAAAELTPAQIRQVAADTGVARVSLDRPVKAANVDTSAGTGTPVVYQSAVGATAAWQQGFTGRGVTVAILDSGIADDPALASRVTRRVDFVSPRTPEQGDPGGHGTHVAGIIAAASPQLTGIAPDARLVSVRVLDGDGNGRLSTVIRGLEWAIAHRQEQGIRVVVLALGAPSAGSYRTDPLAAAAELAWRSGLVVVAASGNDGPTAGSVSTPGVDPLLLTVGASDDGGTAPIADDTVPTWSGRGPTPDGVAKPDVVAPGRKIVSLRVPGSTLDRQMPTHIEGPQTFRLSGTSAATAVVAGTVAVLLQQRPDLDPDGVKALLVRTARPLAGVDRAAQGAGSVDVGRALLTRTPAKDQTRQRPQLALAYMRSMLHHLDGAQLNSALLQAIRTNPSVWERVTADPSLWALIQADTAIWTRVQADRASWERLSSDTALWDALRRNNAVWGALKASSAIWEAAVRGTHASWDVASWDVASWDVALWDVASWDVASWDVASWDVASWDVASWDVASWDVASWDTRPLD